MTSIALVIVLAITVEALVEYSKSIVNLAMKKDKKPFILQLGALAVSIVLALLTGADFYSGLGIVFAWAPLGAVFSGVFLSRGSNYISDFIGKIRKGGMWEVAEYDILENSKI